MTKLAGKTALVTGASRGIGRAIALQLARDGALVGVHFGAARDEARRTLDRIEQDGGRGFIVQADLADPSGHRHLASAFLEALANHANISTFDILVNNSGIDNRKTIDHVTEAEFDRMVQINFRAPFFLIQTLLPHINDGGRIINLSSMVTRAAFIAMPVYAPMKAALDTLGRVLAAQLGPRGITVNAVKPGATATQMNEGARDPQISKTIAGTIALGRVGQPEDVARLVGFLASDDGGWITGETIDVSGGQRL